MTKDEIKKVVDHVAELHGTKARHFEPGTRAGILKRERMAKLSKEVNRAHKEGRVRKVIIDPNRPIDMELIVRGGKDDGKLD